MSNFEMERILNYLNWTKVLLQLQFLPPWTWATIIKSFRILNAGELVKKPNLKLRSYEMHRLCSSLVEDEGAERCHYIFTIHYLIYMMILPNKKTWNLTEFLEDKKGKHNTTYDGRACKMGALSDLVLSCILSSWRTSTCSVPDSLNQVATKGPVDMNLPILHFASSNGAPMPVRSASIAGLRVASPTTLLCLPHPVKMLHKQKCDCSFLNPK